MKVATLLFFVILAYIANAVPVDKFDHSPYPRFIQFPDGDGNLHEVDLEMEPNTEELQEILRNPERNLYLLFTRQNPQSAQTLDINDVDSVLQSNFNPRVPTVVIAHGWLSNQNTDMNPTLRDAFLGRNDVNVIVLDWGRLAWRNYITAALGVPAVGRGLGQFLAFLNSVTGAPFDSMHLVGFSLGAHLVGNAGRELGGRVARITGLDPAGPLWNLNSDRLGPTDAVYVEAIHTDGGYAVGGLGIGRDVGQVDFYPNGGISQPGCLTSVCHHNRSWSLYAATVSYNHLIGNECASNWQLTWNSCRGQSLPLGNDDLRKTGSGVYRVNTGRRYPF